MCAVRSVHSRCQVLLDGWINSIIHRTDPRLPSSMHQAGADQERTQTTATAPGFGNTCHSATHPSPHALWTACAQSEAGRQVPGTSARQIDRIDRGARGLVDSLGHRSCEGGVVSRSLVVSFFLLTALTCEAETETRTTTRRAPSEETPIRIHV